MCAVKPLTFVLLPMLLAAAGCANADPTGVGRYLISFISTPSAVAVTDSAVAQPDFRRIVFNGKVQTSVTCVELEPNVAAEGRDITFTVEAKLQSGSCAQTLGYFTYMAITGNFNPNTYHVKVIHKTSTTSRTLFTGDVVVPQ